MLGGMVRRPHTRMRMDDEMHASHAPTPDATDESLTVALARYGGLVHGALRRVVEGRDDPDGFYDIVRYHLGWVDEDLAPLTSGSGKGLRGGLLLLICAALGGDETSAASLAAGVEMLHNFSLLHDDIEDGSLTRRHRPTVWTIWGTARGINVGDGLYALAHLALLDSPLRADAPALFVGILDRFARATLLLCEGQHLDMGFENRDAATVPVDEYLRMIGGKSAALIGAAAWIGARAAGASNTRAETAYRFGYDLGMAFQMQDDILGIWGDEAVTGKSAVGDITSRKKTLPVLLALQHADPAGRTTLAQRYAAPVPDATGEDTRAILDLLDATGARALTTAYLRRYSDAAFAALAELDLPVAAAERLYAFANLFVERVK